MSTPALATGGRPLDRDDTGANRSTVTLLLILWAVIGAALVASHRPAAEFMSTDDLMRLVQVRDLIAGQNFFDLAQHRLDPPGVVLHWSRLVDLPIAAGLRLLTPLLGSSAAEAAVATVWPVLLLLPLLLLSAALAGRLAGPAARLPAGLLAAVATPVLVHFRPGALDHHGVQILLVLAATLCVSGCAADARRPVAGGIAAAVSLAVGVEMTPALAALIGALGVRWIVAGGREAVTAARFGLAFAGATAALFVAMAPAAHGASPVCDALAAPWFLAALLAGGTLAALPLVSRRAVTVRGRALLGIILGTAGVLAVWRAYPQCLADPYGSLDPRLATLWLRQVMEAQNLLDIARLLPSEVLPLYGPPVLALALGGFVLARSTPEARRVLLPGLAVLAALTAVSVWQMRGAAGALTLAAAVSAAALTRLSEAPFAIGRSAMLAGLVLASHPALSLLGQGAGRIVASFDPGRPAVTDAGREACRKPADFAALAALPVGRVLSLIDLGPAILAYTPHAALAAPYHRNGAGNAAALDVLLGDDATAQRVLTGKRIDILAICTRAPERANYVRAAGDGLIARLARGDVPAFLEPLGDNTPLVLFRVRRVLPEDGAR